MTTLDSLITPLTKEDVLGQLLSLLSAAGFPTTSWHSTSEARSILETESDHLADLSLVINAIAKGGLIDLAEGEWLDLLGTDYFDEARKTAVITKGNRTLVESDGTPHSWSAGELVLVSTANPALIYRNTSSVTLLANDDVVVEFSAESPGDAYNVGADTLPALNTPVPGVALSSASGIGWITQSGTDTETDAAYRTRLKAKWGTLSTTGATDAYVKWALDSSLEITRVKVDEDPTAVAPDPAVTVYVAAATGAPPPAALAAAQTYIEARRPLGIVVEVAGAVASLFTLRGTVRIQSALFTTAKAAINDAFVEYFATLPVGGTIQIASLLELIMAPAGVINAQIVDVGGTVLRPITDDVPLLANQVATFEDSLTY